MNLRVAHLADSSPILQADTTSIRHLAGLPSGWEGTYVDFPESQLVTDIAPDIHFQMLTTGLAVCSAVAIGFTNRDESSMAMYMSHTTPSLIPIATANILSAVGIAEREGYTARYCATIGPENARYRAGHESLRGMIALILDTTIDEILDTKYRVPSRWDFIKKTDGFHTVVS